MKYDNKKVSVVICTKNVEKSIYQCLLSVIKTNPFEIIVIDGMSDDDTMSIVKSFQNIKFFSDNGKGLSYARKIGVNKSKGEYILFVGPDNILKSNFLDNLLKELNFLNLDAAAVSTRVKDPITYWDKGNDLRWRLLNEKEKKKNRCCWYTKYIFKKVFQKCEF